ncbi:MAG: hypothetical protein G01um101419_114 [Parcubacteria group bacterium Gr01-1014_19]|nr:MAG: hypothetical protein G01um101419_114 [Parcubacteria group bacterium Gr01-1014_19]
MPVKKSRKKLRLFCDNCKESRMLVQALRNSGYSVEKKFTTSAVPTVIVEGGSVYSGYSYIRAMLWV